MSQQEIGLHRDIFTSILELDKVRKNSQQVFLSFPFKLGDEESHLRLVIQVSMEEFWQSIYELAIQVAILGIIVIAIALLCSFFLSKSLSAPIYSLNVMAGQIAETMDLSKRAIISGNDEIAGLGHAINSLLDHIEKSQLRLKKYSKDIEEQADKLVMMQTDISEMVDNMSQALFTFDKDLKINKNYSSYLGKIMSSENAIAGTDVFDFIFDQSSLDIDQKRRLRFIIEGLFGHDDFQWSMAEFDFPDEVEIMRGFDKKYMRVLFFPIWDEDKKLRRILVTMEDITKLKNLEKESKEKQENLQKISDMVAIDGKIFETFYKESFSLLQNSDELVGRLSEDISSNKELIDRLFRNVHTLKGNARLFKLNSVQEIAHKAEDCFSELREKPESISPSKKPLYKEWLAKVKDDIASYVSIRKELFGESTNHQELFSKEMWVKSLIARVFSSIKDPGLSARDIDRLQEELERALGQLAKNSLLEYKNIYDDMIVEIAKETTKKVGKINITGNHLLFDRYALNRVNDIILHCLRNAIDHGIESPEERLKSGKSDSGNLEIISTLEESNVVISIKDDGKGLSQAKIVEKAIKKGLVTDEKIKKMTSEEIYSLVFYPGFSTAEKVSGISGRGVGMDAVVAIAKELRGSISLDSKENIGTVVKLMFPNNEQNYMPLDTVFDLRKELVPLLKGRLSVIMLRLISI